MNLINIKPNELAEFALNVINKQEESFYIVRYDDNYVFAGNEIEPNNEYIRKHNIKICKLFTWGGTIVVSKGDIGIGITSHDLNFINENVKKIQDMLISLLKDHGKEAVIEGNDLLVDGYKCGSWCSYIPVQGYYLAIIQISVNMNLDLIKNICMKEMIKVPRALNDFGICTEEVESALFKSIL